MTVRYAKALGHRVLKILPLEWQTRPYVWIYRYRRAQSGGSPAGLRSFLLAHGNRCLENALVGDAIVCYSEVLKDVPDDIPLRLQLSVTYFLGNRYKDAEKNLQILAWHRKYLREQFGVDKRDYRIIGESFFTAFGHLVYLDTYLKSMKLGWRRQVRLVAPVQVESIGKWKGLQRVFSGHVKFLTYEAGHLDTRLASKGVLRSNLPQSTYANQRLALTDEFWYGPNVDDHITWYAPYGAQVERAWKEDCRKPLFSIQPDEEAQFREIVEQVFGLPRDAWFVTFHVRSPGFHSKWHKKHPGTRNADVRTYRAAMDFIVDQGGWVVRLGDPHMPPYSPNDQVVDYATSASRDPAWDVLFAGCCKYFVGTNSGFSLVPPIFGKRCALTNWSPIALPNWYLDDFYIPKLCRDKKTGRLVSFPQMFSSVSGWSQFMGDYNKADIKVIDNSEDDILDVVTDLHEEVFGSALETEEDKRLLNAFNQLSVTNGGYVGSRIGKRFIRKYANILSD